MRRVRIVLHINAKLIVTDVADLELQSLAHFRRSRTLCPFLSSHESATIIVRRCTNELRHTQRSLILNVQRVARWDLVDAMRRMSFDLWCYALLNSDDFLQNEQEKSATSLVPRLIPPQVQVSLDDVGSRHYYYSHY